MIEELNRYIRGWFGYFRMTEAPSVLEEIDGWIRRRIRRFMLKQWKTGRGRRRAKGKQYFRITQRPVAIVEDKAIARRSEPEMV